MKAAASLLLISFGFTGAAAAADDTVRCHAGAYALDDGRIVAIATASEPADLRWRTLDGRSGLLKQGAGGQWNSSMGWTGRPDGMKVRFGTCSQGTITFDGHAGQRRQFDITETTFEGNGVKLRGRLVLPRGSQPVPIAIEVHGSENNSAVQGLYTQYLYPAYGIGVFVYDKRGTGESTGRYTQNFHLLADDARAALAEARRLAGARVKRIGYDGGSQGGWVAPLAASRSNPDFVVVRFGLADSPLAEDRDQVMLDLRNAGYGEDAMAKAREVTDVTGAIVAARGASGWEQLDAVRARYATQPWWPAMKGEFTGLVVTLSRERAGELAPVLEQETSWEFDPMPTLRSLRVPLLWVLAGEDREAPPKQTRERLLQLAHDGRAVSVIEFPATDHGILEFETAADGERTSTRYADGYFRVVNDWISNGTFDHAPYGTGKILAAPKQAGAGTSATQ
ncbi:alpha/beta hydrolase [Lysobacter sp. S4-A87]|uniref:alpha/beta hydrolase family protein n=1 Tax=Lysobacter sp. S4-A87 TaxID=2925843 RepID=UPI001F532274|nr:alpha/beta hydrolase [Lysobacter sp. S4-A87]UNK50158.1 alpha/beta hydrolase [Lysobacter sp. S4-A87]